MMSCPDIDGAGKAEIAALNQSCACLPLKRRDIDQAILRDNLVPQLKPELESRPHLFAGTSVFLSEEDVSSMLRQIEALDAATSTDTFCAKRFASLPFDMRAAQADTKSLMMGYDFHITEEGPRLIEINTNAGGAFLVAALQDGLTGGGGAARSRLIETFLAEWRLIRRSYAPKTLAIVDENPSGQYLYPDMLLAREWLEAMGIETLILDPTELSLDSGKLTANQRQIDFVYNRLTDFYLTEPPNKVLRSALVSDAAVISPAPRHHMLHADKRNLAYLSNADEADLPGLTKDQRDALSLIPKNTYHHARKCRSNVGGAQKPVFSNRLPVLEAGQHIAVASSPAAFGRTSSRLIMWPKILWPRPIDPC